MAERSEFARGWKPLLAGLVGVTCGSSPLPFNVLPVVIGPIHDEFGWSFVAISLGITLYGITGALLAPVFGGLADRYGVRRVAISSLAAFGLSFALLFFIPAWLPGFYALWLLVGLVGIGSTPVTWSRAINMWFYRHRGLALGILLLGTSIAGLVVPQLSNLIESRLGWRYVFPLIALLPLLVALPITLAAFREPGAAERPAQIADASGNLAGMTLGEAMHGYRFWVLFASIALVALAYGGAHIHMVQIVMLKGFPQGTAVSVMSVVALGILSGRVIIGLLFDRFWAPGIAFPVLAMPIFAAAILLTSGTTLTMVMVAGFMLGFAAGAESDVVAYLASRYFGMKQYGRIYGWLYMPFGIFSALSPVLYGAIRDATGSYDLMLKLAMGLFGVGAALLLTLGRYPDWQVKHD
jgi:OFA family oxalate/formate antiporter-like MFS transporter